jgi:hypothetical protein
MPVDSAFEVAAVEAGCLFVSTGQVSAVKFISSMRYLSYLADVDHEQVAVERLLADPEAFAAFVADRLAVARERGNVMNVRHPREEGYDVRRSIEWNQTVRGVVQRDPGQLVEPVWLTCGEEVSRGYDWYDAEGAIGARTRWSGPNPSPRLALPFACPSEVLVRVHIGPDSGEVRGLALDGEAVEFVDRPGPLGRVLETTVRLRDSVTSVLTLHTVLREDLYDSHARGRRVGVHLLGIEVAPKEQAVRDPFASTLVAHQLVRMAHARPAERRARGELQDYLAERNRAVEFLDGQRKGFASELDETRAHAENLTALVASLRTEVELAQVHARNLEALAARPDGPA